MRSDAEVRNSETTKLGATLTPYARSKTAISLALVGLAGWAYWPTLVNVYRSWTSNPDYAHGFLVIPIALAFLWSRRDLLGARLLGYPLGGILLLGVAAAMRYAAARFYLPNLDGWSVPVWIAGLVLLFWGRKAFRWSLPSLAFLWFAVPLPASFEVALSSDLQRLAACIGGWALRLVGEPAIVEGTTILLHEHVLEIERACSGLRMFYGVFAFSVACVVFMKLRRSDDAGGIGGSCTDCGDRQCGAHRRDWNSTATRVDRGSRHIRA